MPKKKCLPIIYLLVHLPRVEPDVCHQGHKKVNKHKLLRRNFLSWISGNFRKYWVGGGIDIYSLKIEWRWRQTNIQGILVPDCVTNSVWHRSKLSSVEAVTENGFWVGFEPNFEVMSCFDSKRIKCKVFWAEQRQAVFKEWGRLETSTHILVVAKERQKLLCREWRLEKLVGRASEGC